MLSPDIRLKNLILQRRLLTERDLASCEELVAGGAVAGLLQAIRTEDLLTEPTLDSLLGDLGEPSSMLHRADTDVQGDGPLDEEELWTRALEDEPAGNRGSGGGTGARRAPLDVANWRSAATRDTDRIAPSDGAGGSSGTQRPTGRSSSGSGRAGMIDLSSMRKDSGRAVRPSPANPQELFPDRPGKGPDAAASHEPVIGGPAVAAGALTPPTMDAMGDAPGTPGDDPFGGIAQPADFGPPSSDNHSPFAGASDVGFGDDGFDADDMFAPPPDADDPFAAAAAAAERNGRNGTSSRAPRVPDETRAIPADESPAEPKTGWRGRSTSKMVVDDDDPPRIGSDAGPDAATGNDDDEAEFESLTGRPRHLSPPPGSSSVQLPRSETDSAVHDPNRSQMITGKRTRKMSWGDLKSGKLRTGDTNHGQPIRRGPGSAPALPAVTDDMIVDDRVIDERVIDDPSTPLTRSSTSSSSRAPELPASGEDDPFAGAEEAAQRAASGILPAADDDGPGDVGDLGFGPDDLSGMVVEPGDPVSDAGLGSQAGAMPTIEQLSSDSVELPEAGPPPETNDPLSAMTSGVDWDSAYAAAQSGTELLEDNEAYAMLSDADIIEPLPEDGNEEAAPLLRALEPTEEEKAMLATDIFGKSFAEDLPLPGDIFERMQDQSDRLRSLADESTRRLAREQARPEDDDATVFAPVGEGSNTQPASDDHTRAAGPASGSSASSRLREVDAFDLEGHTLGKIELFEKLGQGAVGTVYRGVDRKLDKEVAVKVLPRTFASDPEQRERFIQEARTVARFEPHPNIVAVYDVDEQDGLVYIVMQYVRGSSLSKQIQRRGMLSEYQTVAIMRQVLQALDVAHAKGLIHRDIKSDNILITDDGTAKLTDFGLARGNEEVDGRTVQGQLMGTPHYMSPEQARGSRVDLRSDLFSVGVTMYECVTGKRPFDGGNAQAILFKVVSESPRPVRELNPKVSSLIERVIEQLMEKEPFDRHQSAAEVLNTLAVWSPDDAMAAISERRPAVKPTRTMLREGGTAQLHAGASTPPPPPPPPGHGPPPPPPLPTPSTPPLGLPVLESTVEDPDEIARAFTPELLAGLEDTQVSAASVAPAPPARPDSRPRPRRRPDPHDPRTAGRTGQRHQPPPSAMATRVAPPDHPSRRAPVHPRSSQIRHRGASDTSRPSRHSQSRPNTSRSISRTRSSASSSAGRHSPVRVPTPGAQAVPGTPYPAGFESPGSLTFRRPRALRSRRGRARLARQIGIGLLLGVVATALALTMWWQQTTPRQVTGFLPGNAIAYAHAGSLADLLDRMKGSRLLTASRDSVKAWQDGLTGRLAAATSSDPALWQSAAAGAGDVHVALVPSSASIDGPGLIALVQLPSDTLDQLTAVLGQAAEPVVGHDMAWTVPPPVGAGPGSTPVLGAFCRLPGNYLAAASDSLALARVLDLRDSGGTGLAGNGAFVSWNKQRPRTDAVTIWMDWQPLLDTLRPRSDGPVYTPAMGGIVDATATGIDVEGVRVTHFSGSVKTWPVVDLGLRQVSAARLIDAVPADARMFWTGVTAPGEDAGTRLLDWLDALGPHARELRDMLLQPLQLRTNPSLYEVWTGEFAWYHASDGTPVLLLGIGDQSVDLDRAAAAGGLLLGGDPWGEPVDGRQVRNGVLAWAAVPRLLVLGTDPAAVRRSLQVRHGGALADTAAWRRLRPLMPGRLNVLAGWRLDELIAELSGVPLPADIDPAAGLAGLHDGEQPVRDECVLLGLTHTDDRFDATLTLSPADQLVVGMLAALRNSRSRRSGGTDTLPAPELSVQTEDAHLRFSWSVTGDAERIVAFVLERRTEPGGAFIEIGRFGAAARTAIDVDARHGQTYSYRLKSVGRTGQAMSAAVRMTVPHPPEPVPIAPAFDIEAVETGPDGSPLVRIADRLYAEGEEITDRTGNRFRVVRAQPSTDSATEWYVWLVDTNGFRHRLAAGSR